MIQMKMIFNYSARYTAFSLHGISFFCLLLLATSIYAEVAVNNSEKNDKIKNNSLSLQNVTGEQVISGRSAGSLSGVGLDANPAAKVWKLNAEQWELARSGESILSLPVLSQLINTWLLDKHRKIEVRYPGGEEGEFWVHELTDWLVSLGIPSNHVVIIPGSGADDMIKFALIK